jgi:hypothetical protein
VKPKARYRLEHSGEPNSVMQHVFASVDGVTVTVRCVWFAARADPPCCRFSNEHQSMFVAALQQVWAPGPNQEEKVFTGCVINSTFFFVCIINDNVLSSMVPIPGL